MSRSPSRDRSASRAGRTLAAASGGGGGAFDPASLSGNLLWVRAKDQAGANGSTITTWADQSGSSNDLTPYNGPTVVTAATPNSGKAVSCTGGSQFFVPAIAYPIKDATASSTNSTFVARNAIDGDTATWWVSAASTGWLRFRVAAGTIATSYTISPRTDLLTQAPRTWTFGGSNDGTNFTTLDTQTGITFAAAAQTFNFSNATGYAYYKLDVTVNNGHGNLTVADFTINGVANTATAGIDAWIVTKVAATGTNLGLWWLGQTTDASGNETYYPYSTGVVYELAGLGTGNRQSFTPSVALTSWRIYRVANNGTTWQAWLDNTSQATASSKPVKWTPTPRIGSNAGNFDYNGQIAEVLIFNRVLTSGEVTSLIGYLNTEHGLTVT